MFDEQFLKDFRSMSRFGKTARGGVDRQAATLPDGQTRNWFRGLAEGHGLTVEFDEVGNQFALLEFEPGLPYLAFGSHLDSQPCGGRFDGAYGVLSGLHAVLRVRERIAESGVKPMFNLAAINWFNEEGSRFKPSMMGSSVFTGKMSVGDVLSIKDSTGVTVRDALAQIGTLGEFRLRLGAYVEIHIEQGRSLEDAGKTIGLVESTWGANKFEFEFVGEQGHTGATLLVDRQDALYAASSIVVAAREIAERYVAGGASIVSSCGELNVFPNSPVVVPSRVTMLVDMRADEQSVLDAATAELLARIEEVANVARVRVVRGAEHTWGAKRYSAAGVDLARECCEGLGLSHATVRTLAGHDSTNVKDTVPTVMLFVPSRDGISHNELEFTEDADMLSGLHLLTELGERICAGRAEAFIAAGASL